jgi:hypothetical protein
VIITITLEVKMLLKKQEAQTFGSSANPVTQMAINFPQCIALYYSSALVLYLKFCYKIMLKWLRGIICSSSIPLQRRK